jgi:hypothetical protein
VTAGSKKAVVDLVVKAGAAPMQKGGPQKAAPSPQKAAPSPQKAAPKTMIK